MAYLCVCIFLIVCNVFLTNGQGPEGLGVSIPELLQKPNGNNGNGNDNGREVCVPSVTTVKGQASCKGRLIFDSRFDQFLEAKDKVWTIQRKFATAPDYEFVVYEDNPRTLSVYDGHLVVTPILADQIYGDGYITQPAGLDLGEHCTGIRGTAECYQKSEGWYIISPVVSSQISTKGKFSFRYGKIEIRAKLPKGDWLYPELFLNPENQEYGPHFESGQIRIAYSAGNDQLNQKLEAGVILGPQPAGRKFAIKSIQKLSPWADEFHNFTVLWTPASITLSVDNSVYGTILPPEGGFASLASSLKLKNTEVWKSGSKIAPFDKEMNIVIGVGVGGHNFEERTDGSKPWVNKEGISQKSFYKARSSWLPTWENGAKLDVEYVKVWALNASLELLDVCVPSVTTVKGHPSCKGRLIFDSRFDQFLEDKDKLWTIQNQFAGAPDYEFVVYQNNPRTLSVYDGHLVVTPMLTDQIYGDGYVNQLAGLDLGENCTGIRTSSECFQKALGSFIISPVVSSQISTKGKFSFKYGRIEIRAKLPKGDWVYPELFLNPENQEYGPNFESGQIRIAYTPGNDQINQKLEGGVILGTQPAARQFGMKSIQKLSPWADEFHNYTVLWTPASITLSVDNSVYGTVFPPEGGFASLASTLKLKNTEVWKSGSKIAPFDKEMHIVIGVGAGGHNFEDRTDGSKPWVNNNPKAQRKFYTARSTWLPTWGNETKLDVEYVKVWALNE